MQTSNRHSAKRTIFGVLCAALLGGSLFAGGAKSVFADTIGDTLDNSALKVVNDSNGVPQVETTTGSYPGAQANQPWSMYSIPGLNRFRAPSEGSFVKYGYNAWGATGMPLAADISDGTSGDVLANTSAWKAKTTGSPVAITFKSSIKNHGSAFFSLNYVNKNNFVDFGSDDDAPDIAKAWAGKETTAAQDAKIFNQDNSVFSKMKDVNGQLQLDTSDPSNSFSNGYLQATGNVPIQAAVANSKSAVDATLAGDWAVMVRVQVANGIDAKALAASVDWAKSYYYLSIDTIQFLGIQGLGMYNINFPLQFDHHIYLSDNKNEFFLKVKGIPFNVLDESSGGLVDSVKARLQLQNGNSDYVDYLNNRAISSDHKNATTLDFLGTNNNVQTGSTDLNDNDLITRTDSGIQPTFSMQEGNWTISNNPIWDPYGGLLGNYPGHTSILANDLSPVYSTGSTGRMAALLNAACITFHCLVLIRAGEG
ncbi:MAG: hypothetical protein ABF743_04985 [Schleiferilactobacillus perolens]|uniref:hypothetical protein n=1 Tax=Schleiferilactobacillus perolens TaxID=100468 RepID=UPI0039EA1045